MRGDVTITRLNYDSAQTKYMDMAQILMKKLNVALPDEMVDALTKHAEERGKTISDAVRDLLASALTVRPHRTIGEVAMEAIRAGATNQQTLAHVHRLFSDSNASAASIAWYRMTLRKEGETVPTDQEARVAGLYKG